MYDQTYGIQRSTSIHKRSREKKGLIQRSIAFQTGVNVANLRKNESAPATDIDHLLDKTNIVRTNKLF